MKKVCRFCSLILIVFILSPNLFAQTTGLPRLKKGENYQSARSKMLKAGWKPFRSPNADKCGDADARCQGRPEMESCSGTGLAPCRFLWKRKGKTVAIFSIGENAVYNGYEFQ